MGAGDIWEISALSPQFCYEPKIALKKKDGVSDLFLFTCAVFWGRG